MSKKRIRKLRSTTQMLRLRQSETGMESSLKVTFKVKETETEVQHSEVVATIDVVDGIVLNSRNWHR